MMFMKLCVILLLMAFLAANLKASSLIIALRKKSHNTHILSLTCLLECLSQLLHFTERNEAKKPNKT